jgi:predicted PurR-regulated permease PerM
VTKIKPNLTNYFFIAFLFACLYVSFLILKPLIIPILSSLVISFIFYPLYYKIFKKTKNENFSAFIVSLLIVLMIAIPSLIVIELTTQEISDIYEDITFKLTKDENLIEMQCQTESTLCKTVDAINNNPKIRFYVSGAITTLTSTITRNTSEFLFALPKKIFNILIIFLLMLFLFKGGKENLQKIKDLLPLKGTHKDKLLGKIKDTLNGVVYGYLIVALFEVIISFIAFSIVGNGLALILSIIIGVLALIPLIGASVVWIPAAIIYFLNASPIKGLIIVIAGLIIMFLDVWTRNKIIGKKTDIHPVIIALGVLGGIITLGPVGIIVGPVILSLFVTAMEIYQAEKDSFII